METAVRRVFIATFIVFAAQIAMAHVDASGPVGGKPYTDQLNGGNEKFLMELRRRIESAGLSDVETLPSIFVVTAKNRSGQAVTLVVESDTLHMLQIGTDEQAEAGSCVASPKAMRQLK
jgi:hypothetical protein